MDGAKPACRLVLMGPFRLYSDQGREIQIRAAKSRGLLALLALAPQGKRSRSWLQDKLWSDRGREQAGASLRQALSQIRTDLQHCHDLVSATRETVALELSRVEIIIDQPTDPRAQFLEEIDVRDPEFEAWLRVERQARLPPEGGGFAGHVSAPPVAQVPAVRSAFILALGAPRSPERMFEDVFIDCLECSLRETLTVDVFRREPSAAEADPIVLSVQCIGVTQQSYGLRVRIEQSRTRRAIWTGFRIVPCSGAPPIEHYDILALVFEATEALADGLLLERLRSRAPLDAALMARIAVRKIFLMTPDEMVRADVLLTQAFEMDPHPHFLAWRIQLRVIQQMERHTPEPAQLNAELMELTSQALALDPRNSMVLAATANTRLLVDNDVPAGIEMARASLRMNSANPFAWDCLSIGLLMNGSIEEAHRYQLRANEIAARFPIRHFWDMGVCLTSVVTGRYDDAVRLARSATALAPGFRPPLRYLAAILAAKGDQVGALRHAEKLRKLEPDFTFDRLISDASYPVAALRSSGLLSNGALRELAQHGY